MACRIPLPSLPDLPGLAESDADFFPALLSSEAVNPVTGRYSILFAAVSEVSLAHEPTEMPAWFQRLDESQAVLSATRENRSLNTDQLPFEHGWFFYLAYEAIAGWEPRLSFLRPPEGQPLALALKCGGAVVIDHVTETACVTGVSEEIAQAIYRRVMADNARALVGQTRHVPCQANVESASRFRQQVNRVRDYIAAGDVYQVNLAREWRVRSCSDTTRIPHAAQIFRQLAWSNPAPFSGLLQWQDLALISSSPERLVKRRGSRLETRPIAGTRPRSNNARADAQLMAELIAHPKERAEHIMLLDLERNDLGRICATGSVKVDELMVIESYAHVHHIVSNVSGRAGPETTFSDVMKAVFPGGTITGCPKIRCMEIIRELEQRPRGAYTGSMGYLNHNGDMDSNILIRTLVKHGQQLSFMAGAGIVMDSDPHREVAETGHKAEGLLRSLALNMAETESGNDSRL